MAKYHLREDGMPGPCTAQPGNCPLGSDEEHYESKMDALLAAEENAREEGNFLVSVTKRKIFHVSVRGGVEECPFRDGYCEVKPFNKFNNLHSRDKEVIDGAAHAFREAAGETAAPSYAQVKDKLDKEEDKNDGLADWEREILEADAAKAAAAPPPTPVTQQANKIRNDGYDHFRRQGWTEQEIQYYRDSCGHSYPPGRRPVVNRGNSC